LVTNPKILKDLLERRHLPDQDQAGAFPFLQQLIKRTRHRSPVMRDQYAFLFSSNAKYFRIGQALESGCLCCLEINVWFSPPETCDDSPVEVSIGEKACVHP
jgi:hypothetical protein